MSQVRNEQRVELPDIASRLYLEFASDDGVVLVDEAVRRH